jgi:DNA polymerase IV
VSAPPASVEPVRRVAHLDMDAFFASVELLRYPRLRGAPVVIGGSRVTGGAEAGEAGSFARLHQYAGRGVVTTATYEARAFGVHSAMSLMQAAQRCPQAILLPVDFARYRQYSRRFKEVIARFAPQVEDRGVDEVYIDFTSVPGGQEQGGRTLATRIQQAIAADTGLTCSIGVAPNKLLAKLASELRKPNGITILYESELAAKIWPLPARRINGIGPKCAARLEQLGIGTIGELAAATRDGLEQHFGPRHGAWLYACAWGWDDRPVVTCSEPVSMSRETTFERDLHAVRDRAALSALFSELCTHLAQDLRSRGYVGRTVGVKLRYDNFQRATREQTIEGYTDDAIVIRRVAGLALKRASLERPLRLLGVRIAGLAARDAIGAGTAPPEQPLL